MPRKWRARALVAVCLLLVVATVAPPGRASTKPNIVVILTDDQRFDTLWAMPNVQSELVSHGVTYSSSFVVNSDCCPSRASLLTGEYSHSTGVYTSGGKHGGFAAFHDSSTIATWLQAAGYRTALVGKYLNGYGPSNASYIPPGWSQWVAFAVNDTSGARYYDYTLSVNGTKVSYGSTAADYSTDVLAGYATDFIRSTDPSQPLFLELATKAPHSPYTPAPRDVGTFSTLPGYRPPSYNEADVSDKPAYVRALSPLSSSRQASIDRIRRRQYASLLAVDDAVGGIVAALQDTGRLSNTMIVFTSDNGLMWGEHRLRAWKHVPYEESIRVPLVIRYDPLTLTASTASHLVANIDLAPTFAELAGVAAPGADGQSLLPLLGSSPVAWRTDFLVESLQQASEIFPTYCAIRSQSYAYVAYGTGEEELYDLAADPYELQNVATDPAYASTLDAMRLRLRTLCNPPPPGFSVPTEPVVAITSGPTTPTIDASATFMFSSQTSGAMFSCALDGAVPQPCVSPVGYTGLGVGTHTFTVQATDPAGNDGNSARWLWKVAAAA